MALNAIQLCARALIKLGAAPLAAFDEATVEATVARNLYPALRDALLEVPDELVLVETDAPYLTPTPHRGKANGSYLMPYTVRAMADVRDVSEAEMATTLWDNAQKVFGPF